MSTIIRCRSRVTSEKTVQHFGDKRHKFYLEERCSHAALEGRSTCSSCTIKIYTEKTRQYSRKFPHGTIDDPIPSHSHLFGGGWYEEGVKKWGEPPIHIVLCALRYQEEARQQEYFTAPSSPSSASAPSKVSKPDIGNPTVSQPRTMPRPKRVPVTPSAPVSASASAGAAAPPPSEKPVRRTTKKNPPVPSPPLAAAAAPPTPQEELPLSSDLPIEPPVPIKRTRRPRLSKTAADPLPPLSEDTKEEPEPAPPTEPILPVQPPKPPRKSAPRKRPTPVPKKETIYDTLVHPLPVQHKDSCIPTHYEEEMEEKSLSDYETEVVPLTLFTLQSTTYFRDAKKNKIYRRMKEKTLGPYIGRYDPLSETLVTDVPDSDEEDE